MHVVLRQTKIYEIASCQIAAVTLLILTTTECRPNVIVTPLTDAEALVNQEGFSGSHVGFFGKLGRLIRKPCRLFRKLGRPIGKPGRLLR